MANLMLNDLIEAFLAHRRVNVAANTHRSDIRVSRLFLAHVGNIQVRNVTYHHVDTYFTARSMTGVENGSLNVELGVLRALFKFAHDIGKLPGRNPMALRKTFEVRGGGHRRIPPERFRDLLDSAEHPRDRIIVALGMYLLIRQSEIKIMVVGDVDLDYGTIRVFQPKTGKFDTMPLSNELDRELRRWLTWYTTAMRQPLRAEWFLAPRKARPRFSGKRDESGKSLMDLDGAPIDPTGPMGRPHEVIQRSLVKCGYAVRDASGKSTRDGVHTLRRSGATAIYRRLADEGFDGAIAFVQEILHHAHAKQTEDYIGVKLNTEQRDRMIRGQDLYPVRDADVIRIDKVRGAGENG